MIKHTAQIIWSNIFMLQIIWSNICRKTFDPTCRKPFDPTCHKLFDSTCHMSKMLWSNCEHVTNALIKHTLQMSWSNTHLKCFDQTSQKRFDQTHHKWFNRTHVTNHLIKYKSQIIWSLIPTIHKSFDWMHVTNHLIKHIVTNWYLIVSVITLANFLNFISEVLLIFSIILTPLSVLAGCFHSVQLQAKILEMLSQLIGTTR